MYFVLTERELNLKLGNQSLAQFFFSPPKTCKIQVSHFNAPSLSFLICKMEMICRPTYLLGLCGKYKFIIL